MCCRAVPMINKIIVPRLNANEDEIQVIDILVEVGAYVRQGDILFVVESAKASVEVTSEYDGYVTDIFINADEYYVVSSVAMYISDEPAKIEIFSSEADDDLTGKYNDTEQEKKVTPTNYKQKLIHIRSFSSINSTTHNIFSGNHYGGKLPIIIMGAGDHANMIATLINFSNTFYVHGVLAPSKSPFDRHANLNYLGSDEKLPAFRSNQGLFAALACGMLEESASLRHKVYNFCLQHHAVLPVLVHPSAEIDPSAVLGAGVQVYPKAVVGANVIIGPGSVINSGAIISHDCIIGNLSHIAPGAILAGHVEIGSGCIIGMGVTIYIGVKIRDNSVIRNGQNVFCSN